MNNRKQNHNLNYLYILIGLVILLLIWEIGSKSFNNFQIFPDVVVTLKEVFKILSSGEIYLAILTSFGICFLTLIIAFLLAIILGVLAGLFESVNKILTPFIAVMKVAPTAIVVILLLVFVKSVISTFVVIFLVVFPILYEAILNGIKNIDKFIILSLKLEGLYTFNSIFKVIIPTIMPYIYLGIVQSIGLSMKVEIMSEIVIGSQSIIGLGHFVYLAYAINADFIELFGLVFITLMAFAIVDFFLYKIKKYLKKESFL